MLMVAAFALFLVAGLRHMVVTNEARNEEIIRLQNMRLEMLEEGVTSIFHIVRTLAEDPSSIESLRQAVDQMERDFSVRQKDVN